jgi:hypothetical protein
MLEYQISDFIGVFNNAYSKEFCERVIKHYEDMIASGHGTTRAQQGGYSKAHLDDTQLFADEVDCMPLRHMTAEFNQLFLTTYLPTYEQEYAVVKGSSPYGTYYFKIQKTKIGGGYHIWHYESCSREIANRVLVWTLYLNDVDEGGETEFLYQHKRVKPQQGTLVIFPAAFTHAHRGNPPLSNDKYIVTGWVEF